MHVTKSGGHGRAALRLLLVGVMVAAYSAAPATAGETKSFGIAPHPQTVGGNPRDGFKPALSPGGAVRDAVLVYNKSEAPIDMRLYGAQAIEHTDGSLSITPFETRGSGTAAWIRPDIEEFKLAPRQRRVVEFAVIRPQSAPPFAGAIVAEEVDSQTNSAINIVTRVAIQVTVGEGSTQPFVRIDHVNLDVGAQFIPSRALITALVTNGTSANLDAEVIVKVKTLTGRVFLLEPMPISLAPGAAGEFSFDWDSVPRLGGVLKATASIEWDGGKTAADSSWAFAIPYWLLILAIALIFGDRARRARRRSKVLSVFLQDTPKSEGADSLAA